jgi:hypothetical protein
MMLPAVTFSLLLLPVLAGGSSNPLNLFPQPQHVSASGQPIQLAPSVSVQIFGGHDPSSPNCAVGCACSSIAPRYEKLLAVKTSGNFPRSNQQLDQRRTGLLQQPPLALMISNVTVYVASTKRFCGCAELGPATNESYSLELAAGLVTILAETIFGARAGLETLSQMVADHPNRGDSSQASDSPAGREPAGGWGGWVNASTVSIVDRPAYSYRGFMIDTGRHWLPPATIRRLIIGMSVFKLNVMHWHIVDSQSYPFRGNLVPELAEKSAFSPAAIYSPAVVTDIVQFARSRGVRVLPEIEMPGHGEARSRAFPELNLSSNAGVLNPTLNATYDFLVKALSDVAPLFTEPVLFLGGDEVDFNCFDRDPSVSAWMQANCHELQCCANQSQCSQSMLGYFFRQVSFPREP